MLFNSLEFLLYFPLVVGLYFLLPLRWRWLHLLVASYVFYMAWEPAYALLIAGSTVIDWVVALRLQATDNPRARQALLGVSLVVNLGLLGSFKYYNLINSTFQALAEGWLGVHWPLPESNLLLPVGISFYTFQTLGYTIDVYRRELEPERHLGRFALYVSYFPQLVAGPIERASRLLPQLPGAATFDAGLAVSGLRQMGWGFFQKVVVADRLAIVANEVFGHPGEVSFASFLLGTAMFSYQVYCDFAGYSNIAIGAARVMGVDLMANFDHPNRARTIAQFWQRWHISQTTWFRDYVYIGLGGSRKGVARRRLNIVAVFAISGLWHGAGWNFLIWGTVNGLFLLVEELTAGLRQRFLEATGLIRWERTRRVWQIAITLGLIYGCTMPLFRVGNLGELALLLGSAADGLGLVHTWTMLRQLGIDLPLLGGMLGLMVFVDVVDGRIRRADPDQPLRAVPRLVLDVALLFGIVVLGRFDEEAFLYFQF